MSGFLVNNFVSIEWPTTNTLALDIGHEPEVAVRIPFVKKWQNLNAKLSDLWVYQR